MVALGAEGCLGKPKWPQALFQRIRGNRTPQEKLSISITPGVTWDRPCSGVLQTKVPVFTKTPLIPLISPHPWIHVWRFSPFRLVFPVRGDHSTSKLYCQTPRSDFNFGKLFNCQRLRLTHETNNTRTHSPQHFLGVLVLPWVMMKPENNAFSFLLFSLPYRVSLVALAGTNGVCHHTWLVSVFMVYIYSVCI